MKSFRFKFHPKVGPLFSRPFSPKGSTSAAPKPRDYCSTALNSESRDDPRLNPLAKKPPLPAITALPTHGLTMQKLATQLKVPIFTKPPEETRENNEKFQQGGEIPRIRFGEEENKILLFSRPLSPEAVQQWTADVKRRDSFGNNGSNFYKGNGKNNDSNFYKGSDGNGCENIQLQQTFRTNQQQKSELYTGHSL